MTENLLSIVVPVFNEASTIRQVVASIMEVKIPLRKEILVVDDGSSDGTRGTLNELAETFAELVVLVHPVNRGKGAAIRTALAHATGDVVIIQDADLEYDPRLYPQLLAPILDGKSDVVYRITFRWQRASSCFVFLALHGEQVFDASIEHADKLKSHRHGGWVQGF